MRRMIILAITGLTLSVGLSAIVGAETLPNDQPFVVANMPPPESDVPPPADNPAVPPAEAPAPETPAPAEPSADLPDPTGTPESVAPTEAITQETAPASDGISNGVIIAIIAGIAVLAGGGWWFMRRNN